MERQAGLSTEIEITPARIEAGVRVIERCLPDASEIMTLEYHAEIVRELLSACLKEVEWSA